MGRSAGTTPRGHLPQRVLAVVAALAFPVAALGLGVRLAMTSAFLGFEYRRPGFPSDSYGFSTADRELYGSYGLDYLGNDADGRYLGNLRFPDGQPVFTQGEVTHMTDVKQVLGTGLDIALILAALVLAVLLLLRRSPGHLTSALRGGVALTALGTVALAVSALLGWERFFAWVHSLFFSEGTWTFYSSDTLIRLYPEQFWQDAALLVGAVVILLCAAALTAAHRASRSRPRSRRGPRSA